MAVLIFLIIVDLLMMGIVMWYVLREPHKENPAMHPYALEDADQVAKENETVSEPA